MSRHRPLPAPPRPAASRRPAVAWALAMVLLAAQALALWHRTVHGPPLAPAPVGVALHGHGEDPAPGPGPGNGPARATAEAQQAAADAAFGHSSDEAGSCRLYDQAGFGEALAHALPSLAPALPGLPGGGVQPPSAQARLGWRPPARAPPVAA